MNIEEKWLQATTSSSELYEDEKRKKKQRIIRNEFERTGKYGIPLVKKLDYSQASRHKK